MEDTWQPMKTAPEDGTSILIVSGGDVSVARFESKNNTGYTVWMCLADGRDAIECQGDFGNGLLNSWRP